VADEQVARSLDRVSGRCRTAAEKIGERRKVAPGRQPLRVQLLEG